MIILALKNLERGRELKSKLESQGFDFPMTPIDWNQASSFGFLYHPDVQAIVTDNTWENLPRGLGVDVLNAMSQRVPVVVWSSSAEELKRSVTSKDYDSRRPGFTINALELSSRITVIESGKIAELVETLLMVGLGTEDIRISTDVPTAIPYYNERFARRLFEEHKSLSVLSIDGSALRKIEVEYGTEVFKIVAELFSKILLEMWGQPGCYRASDAISRRTTTSYVLFLRPSRARIQLPLPGGLETIADRLFFEIQNRMWKELYASGVDKRIPACVDFIPSVHIGYSSSLHNPCLSSSEAIETVLDHSQKSVSVQATRMVERNRELVLTLIQAEDILYPAFQAVFDLKKLTPVNMKKISDSRSLEGFASSIFAFESLIRVDTESYSSYVEARYQGLAAEFLRPDVLFSIAKVCNLALELDQSCMIRAISEAKKISPAKIMINILPRNLHMAEVAAKICKSNQTIILEISESEAIRNFELFSMVQNVLLKNGIELALDDFGRGFAGLERVIQIKPRVIKFDRNIIIDIDQDPVKQAYLKGLLEVASQIGSKTLAEGVETMGEAILLKKMGVDLIQGYLLHRPQKSSMIADQIGDEWGQAHATVKRSA